MNDYKSNTRIKETNFDLIIVVKNVLFELRFNS